MTEKPKRRWFRFRLSTVLILTAIAALVMAFQPALDWGHYGGPDDVPKSFNISVTFGLNRNPMIYGEDLDNICLELSLTGSGWGQGWWVTFGPKAACYPLAALVTFLAWKAVWAVVERRRTQRATRS
jgi:hypothetical protein